MQVQVSSNAAAILKSFERAPKEIQAGIITESKRELLLLEGKVRSRSQVRSRRGSAGLMGRLTSYARRDRYLGMDAAIGFRKTKGFPYELAQEFGAHARPGKAMAIPVSARAKRVGSPRQFPSDLFIPPGMHVLAEAYKRGGGIKAIHYVLVKSIRPRLNFRKTVIAGLPAFSAAVERGAKHGLEKA